MPEIARFFPAASFALHPTLTVGVSGTLDALGLDLDITQSEAGRAKGVMTLDATGPMRGVRLEDAVDGRRARGPARRVRVRHDWRRRRDGRDVDIRPGAKLVEDALNDLAGAPDVAGLQ